jgi:hypothetical protein
MAAMRCGCKRQFQYIWNMSWSVMSVSAGLEYVWSKLQVSAWLECAVVENVSFIMSGMCFWQRIQSIIKGVTFENQNVLKIC